MSDRKIASVLSASDIEEITGWHASNNGIRARHDVELVRRVEQAVLERAGADAVPVADCWSGNGGDSWRDSPDDCDFLGGLKVGDEYELQASIRSWPERFRVTKVPDDVSDDYAVEPVASRELKGTPAAAVADAQPVCWIERTQLEAVRDQGDDAYVYWRGSKHVAEPDEVPLYAAPQAGQLSGNAGEVDAAQALQEVKRTALDCMPGQEIKTLRSIVGQCLKLQEKLGHATRPDIQCDKPPKGWTCSRGWGHGGPCAAIAASKGNAGDVHAQPMFYLQDSRSFVGNCPLFWRVGGGYTSNVDEAERFTAEDAMRQHECRVSDVPWPCAQIDALRRGTIDMQYLGSIDKQAASFRNAFAASKGANHG